MEKKNREQRRREKFGHTGGATKEPWPQSQANPALSHVAPMNDAPKAAGDQSAQTVGPDNDVTPPKESGNRAIFRENCLRILSR